jgi:hypothetical protein
MGETIIDSGNSRLTTSSLCLGVTIMMALVQWLIVSGYGLSGCILFLLLLFLPGQIVSRSWSLPKPVGWKWIDTVFLMLCWAAVLLVRTHNIELFHNIGDLSARYGYAAVQILKGNHIFPFLAEFEYDETLVAYLLAPWMKWFGLNWVIMKKITIAYASLLIPAGYIVALLLFGRPAAIASAGFLVTSRYFQRCDPLAGLLKFNLVAAIYIISLVLAWQLPRKKRWIPTVLILGILSSLAMYIHSSGRIILCLVVLVCTVSGIRESGWICRKNLAQIGLYLLIFMTLSAPLIYSLSTTSNYFFFKNRQIFGLHEEYPFSWVGLVQNIWSVASNFNYKARLHALFSERFPLLSFGTGTAFLCGIWLMLRKIKNFRMQVWAAGLAVAVGPLVIITPGNWRGFYFAHAVVMVTILGGIAAGALMNSLFPRNQMFQITGVLCLLGCLSWVQLPELYAHTPKITTQETKLFEDLRKEPNIPHFFSHNLHQCSPRLAVYEFTKGAYFEEYYVMLFNPLRFMVSYDTETALDQDCLGGSPAVFVFSLKDKDQLRSIQRQFPGAEQDVLPLTRLTVLRIPGTKDD